MTTIPAISIDDVRAVAPALAAYTENAIVNGMWKRSELSARDRSIVTISALVAGERTIGFAHYFRLALASGVTPGELSEIITQVAFYAGWSTAFSAVPVLQAIFTELGVAPEDLPPVTTDLLGLAEALPGDDARIAMLNENFGDLVPKLVETTNGLLYGEVWRRPGLPVRARNLATLATLIATGQTEFLGLYLAKAGAVGITRSEISETIAHLAFYIGWPMALSAANAAKPFLESASE